ncbi:hypothetical protein DITRI_Ditri08aG0021400 [Diplodiscus trichospermus]
MDKEAPAPKSPPQSRAEQAAIHQDDATDDDENVKQLKECSALYLSLQDYLVKSNRNWKTRQKGCFKYLHFLADGKKTLIRKLGL